MCLCCITQSFALTNAVRARCTLPVEILTHVKGMLRWRHLSSPVSVAVGRLCMCFAVLGNGHLRSVPESVSIVYQALHTACRVMWLVVGVNAQGCVWPFCVVPGSGEHHTAQLGCIGPTDSGQGMHV